MKVTRPPAPWIHDLRISDLQRKCKEHRHQAHQSQAVLDWNNFRNTRNKLKQVIKHTKKAFFQKALSSKRPQEVWKFIHRILYPKKDKITLEPTVLNEHYLSTAPRILNSIPISPDEIKLHLQTIKPRNNQNELEFRHVTYHEVLRELRALRLDCSSGHDHIPVHLIKPIAEYIASPLTHIINMGIDEQKFHQEWKIGKITPIPKVENAKTPDQYRPVTVLPILSKIYERLIAKQVCEFIVENNI